MSIIEDLRNEIKRIESSDNEGLNSIDDNPKTDSYQKTYQKALKLLGYHAYSKASLAKKLLDSGFDQNDVEIALKNLENCNLLNDYQYALSIATSQMLNKGKGKIIVKHKLKEKLIDDEIIEQVFNQIDQNYSDEIKYKQYEILDNYCNKLLREVYDNHRDKIKDDYQKYQSFCRKIYAYAQRRAINSSLVGEIINKI